MPRIFTTLAVFSLLFVAATLVLGLTIGDFADQYAAKFHQGTEVDQATIQHARLHRYMGVSAALVVVLVNSIVVTYFVGTSRWCKEVTETYRLDPAPLLRSTRLKRRTFPWTAIAMLVAVGVVALGGACDPATLQSPEQLGRWVTPHLIGAFAGLAFFAFSFWIEFQNIVANQAVVNEIMDRVRKIRSERGLEV